MNDKDVMRMGKVAVSAERLDFVNSIKESGNKFCEELDNCAETFNLPNGRYFALAKTKMEEAVMWAVKGITQPGGNNNG